MLKEQLLAEAQNLDATVELDSIFESVELSDEVKGSFTAVFEQAVKANAVKLAESHIDKLATRSDELVSEQVKEQSAKIESRLYEDVDKYFGHIAEKWLSENTEAVTKNIKADLFESLFTGMKDLFNDHNVVIPESQVDVVAELEDELAEHQAESKTLFEALQESRAENEKMRRDTLVEAKTRGLTESQVEKVNSLIEGLSFSDKFEGKLSAIVEMVSVNKKESTDKPIDESKATKDDTTVTASLQETVEQARMRQYRSSVNSLSNK